MVKWLYLIVYLTVIVFFSVLFIYTGSLWCWLPVLLIVGDNLKDLVRWTNSKIWDTNEFIQSMDMNSIYPALPEEEVNLFTDVFIKEKEFKV
jgi:hypothetical protein